MKLQDLLLQTKTESDTLNCCISLDLIPINFSTCNLCGNRMILQKDRMRHGLYCELRCVNRGCRQRKSIFKNTIFENIHFPISKALHMIYLKAMNQTEKEISNQISLDVKTIRKFIAKVYEKIDNINYSDVFQKSGGENIIIEVDETHVVSRRDWRGRIHPGERYWVIGGFCRDTKEVRMMVTRRRSKFECNYFILKNYCRNSIIMTDEWRGYNDLNDIGFNRKNVCHKVEFVSSIDCDIHTQHIEATWRVLKKHLIGANSFESIEKIVNRFVFFKNFGIISAEDKFDFLIDINKI